MIKNKNPSHDWYTLEKILSYNCLFNFIIGGRGIGKTFATKSHLFKKAVFKQKPFIYLRRNKTELDNIDKEKFFTDNLLKSVFPDFKKIDMIVSRNQTKIVFLTSKLENEENILSIYSSKILLNGKVICYLKSLSTWVDLKGSEYDDVEDILFDEVLIDTASRKNYLKNEVNALLNLMYSVFRERSSCRIFLLSNATNFSNPYFAFLKFFGETSKRFYSYPSKSVVIEFPPNKPFQGEHAENPFHKLIKGSDVYGSMVENSFQIKDDYNLLPSPEGEKIRLYAFNINGVLITCYYVNGLIYVTNGGDKNQITYTTNISDIYQNLTFIEKSHPIAKAIKRDFIKNLFIYKNLEIKSLFMEVINYVL